MAGGAGRLLLEMQRPEQEFSGMAGACGYPLQETFIKTFCSYYFALLTLGCNSNAHHDVSDKSQQVLD